MARPTMEGFRKTDGSVDWSALHKAETEWGDHCYRCGGYITFGGKGYRELCYECKGVDTKDDEVSHSQYVRCPKCDHRMNMHDGDSYDCFEDGEHEISCNECEHEFTITTNVSVTFYSPPRLSKEERLAEEEE